MFDVAPTELLLLGIVALVVIGPKDLPRAMRFVGRWVGRARGMARHVREGMDEMIRQAELEDMEKAWREENERIMREHPLHTIEARPLDEGDASGATYAMTPLAAPDPAQPVAPGGAGAGAASPDGYDPEAEADRAYLDAVNAPEPELPFDGPPAAPHGAR